MITFLKWLLGALLICMIYVIVSTSLESSLIEELPSLIQIPWMKATLYDFYTNVLCLFLFIAYKERSWWKKILWLIFLVTMGSVGTVIYLLKELINLNPDEDLSVLLSRKND